MNVDAWADWEFDSGEQLHPEAPNDTQIYGFQNAMPIDMFNLDDVDFALDTDQEQLNDEHHQLDEESSATIPNDRIDQTTTGEPIVVGASSELDWDTHKATIVRLYHTEDKTLSEVMRIMRSQFRFDANEKQFRRQFARWQIEKKVKTDEMRKIIQIKRRRHEEEGKETEFVVRNRPVPDDKINRFIKRNGPTITPSNPAWQTPPCIVYYTPTPHRPFLQYQHNDPSVELDQSGNLVASILSSAPPKESYLPPQMVLPESTPLAGPGSESVTSPATVELSLRGEDLVALAALHNPNIAYAEARNPQSMTINGRIMWAWHRILGQLSSNPRALEATRGYRDSMLRLEGLTQGDIRELLAAAILDDRQHHCAILLRFDTRQLLGCYYRGVIRAPILNSRALESTPRTNPLQLAFRHRRYIIVRMMILHGLGVDVARKCTTSMIEKGRPRLLFWARHLAERGEHEIVGFLHRTRLISEADASSMLYAALVKGQSDLLVDELLQDETAIDLDEMMLHASEIRSTIRKTSRLSASLIVRAAAASGARSNKGATALHLATALLLKDEVKEIIKNRSDVNDRTVNGDTAMHIACGIPDDDGLLISRIILESGADINAKNSSGDECLHVLVRGAWLPWKLSLVRLLVHHGANINARNDRGETCLSIIAAACALGQVPDAMRSLEAMGADENIPNNQGHTPDMTYAARWSDQAW